MLLRSLSVLNEPPIVRFEATELSNLVVLAGPNGVGKTRLIQALLRFFQNPGEAGGVALEVEATCTSERTTWGKAILNTREFGDAQLLATTLRQDQQRSVWRSSVLNFDADRTVQQIQPFQAEWDYADPWLESVAWNMSFSPFRDRFQDTQRSIFRKLGARRAQIANRAEQLELEGAGTMALDFPKPLEPFKDAFALLLGPKRLLDPHLRKQRLEYDYEGQTLSIDALSSGEREVVNIAFDFLLRGAEDCIVLFDEPELHLHPELTNRLLQTLRTVGERNQFILSTHSPDVISASLDNSVVFIAPSKPDQSNQAIPVSEDDETNQALRLLGQSIGIIALGRKIVLIEGTHSSLDKQTYDSIIRNRPSDLVLVPSGGKGILTQFSSIVDSVLSKSLWGVDFFMLCDRDAVPFAKTIQVEDATNGKLRALNRYHLENYYLDEGTWSLAFANMEGPQSWLRDPDQIRAILREIAREMVPYAAALTVSASFRQAVGSFDLMPKAVQGVGPDELTARIVEKGRRELARAQVTLDESAIAADVQAVVLRLTESLDQDSEIWKREIPGRQLLHRFASRANEDVGRMKMMYLNESARHDFGVFKEVVGIFDSFAGYT